MVLVKTSERLIPIDGAVHAPRDMHKAPGSSHELGRYTGDVRVPPRLNSVLPLSSLAFACSPLLQPLDYQSCREAYCAASAPRQG
jgi:hypothetical protein